jgi:hypothetical protein
MACEFIRCVVHSGLVKIGEIRGLSLIEALARTDWIEKLDIVTVNHDLLVERLLGERGFGFADGFGKPAGDVRYFDSGTFYAESKIRLFKLHGSINWYRFRGEPDNPFSDRYGIPIHGDVWHCKDENGRKLDNIDAIPWILTGTNNKAAQYGFSIYAEMHFWFHKLLQEHGTIAMSGYGWSDRGINGRLMQWLLSPDKRRLFLMHERLDELTSYSKSSLWHRYEPLVSANRIIPIAKWMEHVSFDDLWHLMAPPKRSK